MSFYHSTKPRYADFSLLHNAILNILISFKIILDILVILVGPFIMKHLQQWL